MPYIWHSLVQSVLQVPPLHAAGGENGHAVYLCQYPGGEVYCGESKSLQRRLKDHRKRSSEHPYKGEGSIWVLLRLVSRQGGFRGRFLLHLLFKPAGYYREKREKEREREREREREWERERKCVHAIPQLAYWPDISQQAVYSLHRLLLG